MYCYQERLSKMADISVNLCYLLQSIVIVSSREPWIDKQDIQCKNIEDASIDWWYIYKTPANPVPEKPRSSEQISINQTTGVFSYITPGESGTWDIPDLTDLGNGFDMLQLTLAPIFQMKYTSGVAVVVFDYREGNTTFPGSHSSGALIANDDGGVYVGYSVPGLIDEASARLVFPQSELKNGHLFMCLSLSLDSINDFATVLRVMKPRVTHKVIPFPFRAKLKQLDLIDDYRPYTWSDIGMPFLVTTMQGKNFIIYHRSPTDNKCLYAEHAKLQSIILDVYDHKTGRNHLDFCNKNYGLRTIKYLSVKSQKYIQYIKKSQDRSMFAVSTAAHWQQTTLSKTTAEYWICVSNVGRQDGRNGLGAMLICTEQYDIWRAFMNMKVDEPRCIFSNT